MTNQHPIPSPPPELVQQWHDECHKVHKPFLVHIANQAARWGADQELEACVEWLYQNCNHCGELLADLRTSRRPKPPSLKEQALALLEVEHGLNVEDLDLLRRALEALPND